MKVKFKHDKYNRGGLDRMEVGEAVGFELSDDDPVQQAKDTKHLLARLVHTLHKKGLLIPSEVITVLGSDNYEEVK